MGECVGIVSGAPDKMTPDEVRQQNAMVSRWLDAGIDAVSEEDEKEAYLIFKRLTRKAEIRSERFTRANFPVITENEWYGA